jgi:hypothetical protein
VSALLGESTPARKLVSVVLSLMECIVVASFTWLVEGACGGEGGLGPLSAHGGASYSQVLWLVACWS